MKKKVKIIILVCGILLVGLLVFHFTRKAKYEKIGKSVYDLAINDYTYDSATEFKFETDSKGKEIVYYFNDEEYYKVLNLDEFLSHYTKSNQKNFLVDLAIVLDGDDYYLPSANVNFLNYYIGYDINYSHKFNNKVYYTISSKYCSDDDIEFTECNESKAIISKADFVIEKSGDNWLVDSFAFPINDIVYSSEDD